MTFPRRERSHPPIQAHRRPSDKVTISRLRRSFRRHVRRAVTISGRFGVRGDGGVVFELRGKINARKAMQQSTYERVTVLGVVFRKLDLRRGEISRWDWFLDRKTEQRSISVGNIFLKVNQFWRKGCAIKSYIRSCSCSRPNTSDRNHRIPHFLVFWR